VNAALIAAVRVLAHEFPEHRLAGLDLADGPQQATIDRIDRWLRWDPSGRFVADRQGQHWEEAVAPTVLPPDTPWPLAEGETVLITGAAGGVGRALALEFARAGKAVRLLLAVRNQTVPDALLAELSALGASPHLLRVDLSDEEEAAQALVAWQREHGEIDAVVHAAGLADLGGVLVRRDRASLHAVLAPKIAGLHAIERALDGKRLRFVVLCSTLGSFLPAAKFGQVAYSAANAYLDAAAGALAARQPWRIVAIDWDDWVGPGMTGEARRRAGLPPLDGQTGLLPQVGATALRRVLGTALPRVAIAVNDLPALMKRTGTWLLGSDESPANTPADLSADRSVDMPVNMPAIDACGNAATSAVVQLFREVLNAPDCGERDSFFDLGGHSLLAMQLLGRIREQTGHTVTLTDLFGAPSPAELARVLAAQTPR
jgi:NAD(P)-dependent dehydrogenase (short-subunit alcohol dehydrogenase family)